MTQNKHMTAREAWILSQQLINGGFFENIIKLAVAIKCAHTTIYRWKDGGKTRVDGYIAMNLKEVAIEKGIITN